METETGNNGEREREKKKRKRNSFELQNSFMRHTPHPCLRKKENKEAELVPFAFI
jgi:hypothetical protein